MIPIDADDQNELIEALKDLVARFGSDDFLHAPIVLPTEVFFPDAWRGDLPSFEPMIARLLARVRLGHLKFKVARVSQLEEGSAVLIRWAGRDAGRTLLFEVNPISVRSAQVCAEAVQREIARVWLSEKLGRDHVQPFGAGGAAGLKPLAGVGDDQAELDFEVQLDVASVYLGFGALSANLGVPARWDEEGQARFLAAIPAIEGAGVAFLVGVMIRARSRVGELEAVLPQLTELPREALQSMQPQLMPGETYRRWLEIPAVGRAPDPPVLPAVVATVPAEKFEVEEYTLRKRERRLVAMGVIGALVALVTSIASFYASAIVLAAFVVLGWVWTYEVCWRCGFFLKPAEVTCFNCRALVVGTINGDRRVIEPRFTEDVRRLEKLRAERERLDAIDAEQLEKEASQPAE